MKKSNENIFTRFTVTAPPTPEGQWRIKSLVQNESIENGDVIILLRKNLKVDQATHALYQVAMLLKNKEEKARAVKQGLKGIATKSRWVIFMIKVFGLPMQLIDKGILWIKRHVSK